MATFELVCVLTMTRKILRTWIGFGIWLGLGLGRGLHVGYNRQTVLQPSVLAGNVFYSFIRKSQDKAAGWQETTSIFPVPLLAS